MINWSLLQDLLFIAVTTSALSVAFIQKTKVKCKNSTCIGGYSFIVNMLIGTLFVFTFTDVNLFFGPWVGLFSFIGADTIYKTLEGKIQSFNDLTVKQTPSNTNVLETDIPSETPYPVKVETPPQVNSTDKKEEILGEITYD